MAINATQHSEDTAAAVRSVRWLKILSLLSIAVPLFIYIGFGAVRYLEAKDEAQSRVGRSLRVAHEHASKVMATSQTLHDKVHALVAGKDPQALRSSEALLHEALQQRVRDQPQVQSILILDAQGVPLASSRVSPFPKLNMSDGDYFVHHSQGSSGLFVSKPIITRTSNHKVLNLSVGFKDHEGKFAGVINLALLSSYFQDYFDDLVADEPGLEVTLFREDGYVYAQWPRKGDGIYQLAPNSVIMQQLSSQQRAAYWPLRTLIELVEADAIGAYRKVQEYPLFVSTRLDLAALRIQALKQFGLVLLMGLLPIGALFLTARAALRSANMSLQTLKKLEKEIETRHLAEAALLQAQKLEALGRLTGGVAHDFNNALMVISNNIHLIKRSAPEISARQIESISKAVKSAANLTRQLLAFSRRQPLVVEQVSLQEKMPPIKELISPVLGSQIHFHLGVAEDTLPVVLDTAELELSLLNLCINARDAMPKGGAVSILARNAVEVQDAAQTGAMVVIEVADTGSGIEPELLTKVFEPFFTTKPVGEGTGLGLSQVYGMCQRAGGRVEIASAVGTGTRISLFLPASTKPMGVAAETAEPVVKTLERSVLLVEDNDDVAASLVQVLESIGCHVVRVDRAHKAKDLLEQGSTPDLLLSDVMMPGEMNGAGLAVHVRNTWPRQRLLLMTGYAEQLDEIERLGFDVLPKPSSPQALLAAIERATRNANSI